MEFLLQHIKSYLVQILLAQLLLTIAVVIMVFRHPELILRAFQRYWMYKYGFKVKNLEVEPGYRIEYMERGSQDKCAASVLLVHGFTSAKDSYCAFASHLPKRFHLVALDLPGHGGTSQFDGDHHIEAIVKRIKQFCNAVRLNQRQYHVIGTSLGGLIAGLYAKEYQAEMRSVTLMCPAGVTENQMPLVESVYQKTGKFLLLPETDEEFCQMFDILLHKKTKLPGILVSGIMKIRMKSHDFYTKLIKEFEEGPKRTLLSDNIQHIKIPTMILWGKQDQVLDVSALEVLREKLPAAKVEVIDPCGHTIVMERPRKAAGIVTQFIDSH